MEPPPRAPPPPVSRTKSVLFEPGGMHVSVMIGTPSLLQAVSRQGLGVRAWPRLSGVGSELVPSGMAILGHGLAAANHADTSAQALWDLENALLLVARHESWFLLGTWRSKVGARKHACRRTGVTSGREGATLSPRKNMQGATPSPREKHARRDSIATGKHARPVAFGRKERARLACHRPAPDTRRLRSNMCSLLQAARTPHPCPRRSSSTRWPFPLFVDPSWQTAAWTCKTFAVSVSLLSSCRRLRSARVDGGAG